LHWQDDKPIAPEGIEKARKAKVWLDERGVPLSPAKLAAVSRHWSPAEWEAYLEDAEVALREDLGQRKDRRVLLDEFEANEDGIDTSDHHPYETEHRYDISDSVKPLTEVFRPAARIKIGDNETSEEIIPLDEQALPLVIAYERDERRKETRLRIIERALQTLPRPQQLVIWHIFWEGRTEREIVRFLRRSRRTIRTWRDRAFVALRAILSPIFRKGETGTIPLSEIKRGLRGKKKRPGNRARPKRSPKFRVIRVSA